MLASVNIYSSHESWKFIRNLVLITMLALYVDREPGICLSSKKAVIEHDNIVGREDSEISLGSMILLR